MKHLSWIVGVGLVAACGGGKAGPKTPPATAAPDAGAPVVEEPDAPPDAAEAMLDVSGIMPTNGPTGTVVTIHGSAFTKDDRTITVYFGARKATVQNVTDTEITVAAPKGSKGDVVDLLITFEPGGEIRLPDAYSYPEE